MNRPLPAQAGSLLAAFLLTLAASCLAAAAFTANAAGASARGDRDREPRGAGKRSQRRSCLARVRERQGVGRRAAVRICKRRSARAPGSGTPAAPTVAAVSTPAAAAGAGAAPAAAAPVAAAGCPGAETIPTSAGTAAVRAAVLCLVNAERAANGLGALTDNGPLTVAAQAHSDDMVSARYFSHTSVDGRSFAGRIAAAGYGGAATAENIAWGAGAQSTPARIVTGWMSSPGHRANILNASLSTSGVGVARGTPTGGSGATYTHDFGG